MRLHLKTFLKNENRKRIISLPPPSTGLKPFIQIMSFTTKGYFSSIKSFFCCFYACLRLLAAVVGIGDDEDDDGEDAEERLGTLEGVGHVVVDGGGDFAGGVDGVAILEVLASRILGEHLDRVGGGRSVHGERDFHAARGSVGDAFLEELGHLGRLPALLVLVDGVFVLAPRAVHDLVLGEAELHDHGVSGDGEVGP